MRNSHVPPAFADLPLDTIRNRTERMVLTSMERILPEMEDRTLTEKDKCDIYALACNSLPSRYTQPGTIVLGRTPQDMVDEAVRAAYESVVNNPKI